MTSTLLEAARTGNEDAFRDLVEPHQRELHAHCYQMLGSLHDAEDAYQDAMIRAWRGLDRFEGRSSLRSWLYRIATNTCMDIIGKRSKRILPLDHGAAADPADGPGQPLVESVWVEPYPDETLGYEQREGVELAFIAALQHLSPNQRAALILREVLGFSAQEAADSLDASAASVNSALQRARKTVEEKLPEQSQQVTLRSLGDKKLRGIVEAYMEAMQRGDVGRVVSMLAKDAAWSMPPLASWYRGDQIEAFLQVGPLSGNFEWRHLATTANGQPAIGAYTWHEDEQAFLPFALDVLTFEGDKIKEVTAFITRSPDDDPALFPRWPDAPPDPRRVTDIFERFGLPARLSVIQDG